MKKYMLTGALVALFFAANAQDNSTVQPPATSQTASVADADATARQFMEDLQLSEGQYIYFKNINRKRAERMNEINSQFANDPQLRQMKIDEMEAEIDNELAQVLNEAQMNSYLELQGRGVASQAVNMDENMKLKTTEDSRKLKTDDMKLKQADGEMKMKAGDSKMKADAEKYKYDSPDRKVKMEDNKMKVETPDSELKISGDEEKYKSGDLKYKAEPGKTKLQQGDSKVKVDEDKTKIEAENGDELKVTKKKAKLKTNNQKTKVK